MITCPSCHAENEDDAEACFGCGASLATRVTLGTVIASRYEVLSRLGRGGMGTVYKVRDTALNANVALKVLRPEIARSASSAERRFRAEIKLARRVTHPNVCQLYDFVEDADLRCISMELIEGTQLRQLVRERSLSREAAYEYALQIAAGLTAIHKAGIVHRDLKTANIMVDQAGVLRLMDFGIARPIRGDVTREATTTGGVVGTPEYMSPEQARGESVDERSDVYSMGVVLFELFTGDVPFRGDSPVATVIKQLNEIPPLSGTSGLPLALVPVVQKALAKYPPHRFQSIGELTDALQRARSALLAGAGPVRHPLPVSPPVDHPSAQTAKYEAKGLIRHAKRPAMDARALITKYAKRATRHDPWWVLPAAVVAVLTAIFTLSLWEPRVPSPAPTPAAPTPVISLIEPGDGAELISPEGSVRLVWATTTTVAWFGVRVVSAGGPSLGQVLVDEPRLKATSLEVRGLAPGDYRWQVWTEGRDFPQGSPATARFVMRASPPGPQPFLSFNVEEIELPQPGSQQGSRPRVIRVWGRTEPGATVSVNGVKIAGQDDGSFETFTPKEHLQQVTVRAVAVSGGVNEQTRMLVADGSP